MSLRSKAWAASFGAFCVSALSYAHDASACSCIGGAYLAWPPLEATGVPTDTTFIFYLSYEGPLVLADETTSNDADAGDTSAGDASAGDAGSGKGYVLRDDRGTPTFLESVRNLDSQGPCTSGVQILRPRTPLEPETHYTLYRDDTPRETFTTGVVPYDPKYGIEAASKLEYSVASPLGTDLVSGVFIDGLGAEPLLLHLTGSFPVASLVWQLDDEPPLQFEAGRSECLQLNVFSLDGSLLDEREFCEPDRCYEASEIGSDSCGTLYDGLNWDTFSKLPETGSCSAPGGPAPGNPPPEPNDDGESNDDGDTTSNDDSDPTPGSDSNDQGVSTRAVNDSPKSGCSLTQGATTNDRGSLAWLLALSALALSARNRTR